MSDDKTEQRRDRNRVAGDQEYEVRYFVEKHGITIEQAQELIDRHGNSREVLDAAAQNMRG